MVSRHSIFYSPLIATIAAGFLERHGLAAEYSILAKEQRSRVLIRESSVDIMQSAVSSNWKPLEQGESPLPVHFAQINQRDGFFLVAREPDAAFEWNKLAGQTVLADHAAQPLVMLKYAARSNGVEWPRVDAIDAGAPEEMARAFRQGRAAYVHLQSPAAHQLECDGAGHVVASMPPVAFSSLCCSRDFAKTETLRRFVEVYGEAREWVRTAPAKEVARAEAGFFEGSSIEALAAGIQRYQAVGCWEGGIARRHPYEEVCLGAG
jgi:NitT/TauT family transport system substrate-binding protein